MAQSKHLSEDEIKYIVSVETVKSQEAIYALSKETKQLRKEETARRKAMVELEAQGKKNTEDYRNLDKECKEYTKQISINNKKMDEMRKKLDVNAMSMVQLKRQAKDLRAQMDNMSKALNPTEYAELERQLQKVNDRMGDLKVGAKSLAEIAKSEGTIAVMFGTLFSKMGEFAGQSIARMKDFVLEGINMAESADGITRAFRQMDDGTMLDNLRKATKGTVTDLDLMKASVKAKDFRIPLEDLGKYLQFAQLKAQQTGQSVDYMTDSIVTGLGRKSLLILDNLGLSAAEINEEVAKTGDFMSAVASIIDKRLVEAGGNYVSAADRATQKTVELQNAQRELGEILLPIKERYDEVYGSAQISTMQLIGWIVKHRAAIGVLITAVTTYVGTQKIAVLWNKKHAESTLISVAAEKMQALRLNLSRRAFLAKLIVMDLYKGRCNLATAATEMFNLVLKASPLGIVTTLATTAAAAFFLFGNKTSVANKAVSELNKRLQTERAELGTLFSELKKTNPGTSERTRLIEELNTKYPGLLKNYDLEHASLKEITRAQNEANVALTNRIATEMKATTLADYVSKNITHQMDIIEYLMVESYSQMGEKAFSKLKPALEAFFNEPQKDMADFWNTFGQYFHSTLANDDMTAFRDAFILLREDQKNLATGVDEINKKYEPYIKSIKTVTALSDEEIKKQVESTSIIIKLEKEKEKVQNTWKEDTKANIILKNREIERLDNEIKKYKELGKVKVDENASKKKAEAAQKAQLDAEKQLIADLKSLRDQKLSEEQKELAASLNIQKLLLLNKKISQKEYDIWEAAHENNSADKRLSIEKDFAAKSENLNLKHNELKEAFVKESANRVEKAEQTSFDTRLKAEQTYRNNIDALRKMAEQTPATPEAKLQAEYETNLQLTEAYYQASLEYAREHGQSETEITALYDQATLNLDKKYQEEKKKLVKQTTEELKALQGNEISAQFTEIFNSITKLQDAIANMDFEGVMQSMQALVNATLNGLSDAFNTFKQIEIDNVEAKYDAEIKAAQGNGEEIERLEQEKAQKKLDVEKKYADVQFAIKASEILANTALAITMALAQLGPIAGPIAAGLMGATGAIQLAAANAERQKVKNMTLSGSSSSSNAGTRVATGRESGGKIDVKRAQDGKLFPDADYDPDARGFIDRPTVIVGEGPSGHSKEWVASNAAVSNPTIAPILNILDKSQQAGTIRTLDLNQVIRARMAGYSSGGTISKTTVSSPDPISPDSGVALPPELMRRFANAIINMDEHGIPASVSLTELEAKQKLRSRSRAIGSK